ncbi:unnamed protein product [Mytilus edulis]|uniref:Uncharacterized protein n=1 Tax=Mytilus edulis TaxID=6550 RepID=A0A8S3SEN9_MYTED|nr:unnamed protein product [Mytilus edulis]
MELSKWQGQKPDRPHNCKWEMEKVSDVGVKRGADCGKLNKEVKKQDREDKLQYIEGLENEAEEACKRELSTVYKITKQLYWKSNNNDIPVLRNNGEREIERQGDKNKQTWRRTIDSEMRFMGMTWGKAERNTQYRQHWRVLVVTSSASSHVED